MIHIKIKIPEKVSANASYASMHWGKRKRLADLYHNAFLEFKNKYKVEQYPIEMNFVYTFKSRTLDVDNVSFTTKMCIDGLRYAKIIGDDDYEHLRGLDTKIQKGTADTIDIFIV